MANQSTDNKRTLLGRNDDSQRSELEKLVDVVAVASRVFVIVGSVVPPGVIETSTVFGKKLIVAADAF